MEFGIIAELEFLLNRIPDTKKPPCSNKEQGG